MKNIVKYQAESFTGIAIAILAFGFLASGSSRIVLFIASALFGFGSLMLVLSIRFKSPFFIRAREQLFNVRTSHFTIFLALVGLTMIVWQQQLVVLGIVVLYIAYITFGAFIGIDFGNALVTIYCQLFHKELSVKRASRLMGISESRVRKLLIEGRILGKKENNKWVVLKLGYKRKT